MKEIDAKNRAGLQVSCYDIGDFISVQWTLAFELVEGEEYSSIIHGESHNRL